MQSRIKSISNPLYLNRQKTLQAGVCATAIASIFILASQTLAQEEVPDDRSGRDKVIQMIKTDTPPIIDGIMDDVWSTAAVVEDFHQTRPNEYTEPSERTVVYVLYGERAIYVGARMIHKNPEDIIAATMIQGGSLRFDDKFGLYINPFNDGRNGYYFQTNANAIRSEAIFENVSDLNRDWTGIWFSGAERTEEGWFAEIAVPYNTISFDPSSDAWGISFQRGIESNSEDVGWTSVNRSTNPSNFGTAVGMTGMKQGIGLDVIPAVNVTNRRSYDPESSSTEIEPSLNAFYKFTPNLTGALTLNTDFSATDVDNRQVQLTRFSLFFPEQRKFFLQEADIFEFGGLNRNGKPFFSRRIGMGPGGQNLNLDAGGKLTGRIGRWNIGALAVKQTGNSDILDELPPGARFIEDSELFVGRASANVLEQSNIGAIVTYGNPTRDEENKVVGVDFNYLNNRSFENITIEGRAWYQKSDTEGLSGDDEAWGFLLASPNNNGFYGTLEYGKFGEDYFPALGFANRVGIKQAEVEAGHIYRFGRGGWLRSFENTFELSQISDTQGNVQTEELELEFAKIENQRGDQAYLLYNDIREVLIEPFKIADGVTIPIGDYSFERYGVTLNTGGQRPLRVTLLLEDGSFFGGNRKTAEFRLDFRPSPRFTGALEYEYNNIDLPQGNFTTQLVRLRADIAITPEWAWVSTVQYDNQSELLGANSRLQWIPRAGSEFYVIYNGGWRENERNSFDQLGQSATMKVGHTFRF
ncbi:MAG: DUF5916 domain-containing protein [Arenicellaceae bacterium]|nr:DUF5916 domain-containing protein [Arenicellaceae bacterium]